ncbi:MAG TPA: RNB domain-containing ribonuclease, partial [Candidatus Binataceae bacterium]|nr:RNB domain-containing ribonuclease [Candidatus Binataceae bacterium]
MERTTDSARDRLRSIARNAMIERGLLPDFSPAVMAELRTIARPAGIETSLRDSRSLPWASIDNDDSRDLDQLSVAVPVDTNAVKVLVAIADVDAIVKKGSAIDGHA